jgi:MoaA/NifB/PqqE/SkfB family radical SAM enzyme
VSRSITDPAREQVAEEPRHWVRICRACNNRCAFCLDSDVQDGSMIPASRVEEEIAAGLEQGASRLILSGGEATIHPDFLHLVRFGKRAGYGHVQTVTNGRMFAYRDFARAALDAGLDEVTFSMHGHTPELHDELTGVKGSFLQTIAGIRNVVSSRRAIVSGDVVVNHRNVAHLREVLDLFMELGVREFDVLMVVPFGRASPGEGADVLFDPEAHLPHLHEALELSHHPSVHLWTNRLEPRLLEGYEHLIQDPHKLSDEVRGRRGILRELVEGRPMRCAGERCRRCFIHPLCSSMQRAVRALARGVPDLLYVDLDAVRMGPVVREVLAAPRRASWIRARDVGQLAGTPGLESGRELWLELDSLSGLGRAVSRGEVPAPARLVVRRTREARRALSSDVPRVVVVANRYTLDLLEELVERPGDLRRVVVEWRSPSTLREAIREEPETLESLGGLEPGGWLNVPPCLSEAGHVRHEEPFDLSAVGEDGLVDTDAFVETFIRWSYRVKSPRCVRCRHDDRCRGLPINTVRRVGLGVLEPHPRDR